MLTTVELIISVHIRFIKVALWLLPLIVWSCSSAPTTFETSYLRKFDRSPAACFFKQSWKDSKGKVCWLNFLVLAEAPIVSGSGGKYIRGVEPDVLIVFPLSMEGGPEWEVGARVGGGEIELQNAATRKGETVFFQPPVRFAFETNIYLVALVSSKGVSIVRVGVSEMDNPTLLGLMSVADYRSQVRKDLGQFRGYLSGNEFFDEGFLEAAAAVYTELSEW